MLRTITTNIYKNLATGGGISLSADTFYCALLDSTVDTLDTSAIQRYESYADIASIEVAGSGYTTSGEALSNLSVSASDAGNKSIWIGDDLTWTNATISPMGACIYKDGGTPLLGVLIFDDVKEVSNASFNLKFTNGIMNIN